MRTLAVELRAGGLGTATFAFALGALHGLTPGHGKAALAAYFLGREAHIANGVRIALSAALLQVLSGFGTFLVLRLAFKQVALMTGRPSVSFTALGYALIIGAGRIMVAQSLRSGSAHGDAHGHALIAGMGLLPRPLTISVLAFAWTQSTSAMVGLVLLSLALGISLTIGIVAVAAIVARRSLGGMLFKRLSEVAILPYRRASPRVQVAQQHARQHQECHLRDQPRRAQVGPRVHARRIRMALE